MFGARKFLLLGTLFLSALSNAAPDKHARSIVDWQQFQDLLDDIHPDAIHHALHSLNPKFQDGVFSQDRAAIEQVHSENPEIASKLVRIAKRQSSNSTTAAAAPSPSTPAQSSAVSESSSRAASVSQALSSAIYASTVPPPTTVLVAPIAPISATPILTTNGAVVYSSFGGGLVTLTSSAEAVSFTPSTSTHLYYTTLPDGQVETSTSVVVVNAPVTATAGGPASGTNAAASATASGTKAPGLQSGAARPTQGLFPAMLAVMGGALAFAIAL